MPLLTPSVSPAMWRSVLYAAVLCLAVAGTNRYGGPPLDPSVVPGDAYSYLRMAQSAPGLPEEPLIFHHSQRIALPYVLGLIGLVVPMPIHDLFRIAVVFIWAATLYVVIALFAQLSVAGPQTRLVLALLILNPWTFRPYLTYPEMINDLGFVLGLALMLRGLLTGRGVVVLAGQAAASLTRQTGVPLAVAAAIWLWRDTARWGGVAPRRRLALGLALLALAAGIYVSTALLAERFSYANENLAHLAGLWVWLTTLFDAATLAGFLVRAVLPVLPPLLLLTVVWPSTGAARDALTVRLLAVTSLLVWAQPLLGGPDMTSGTIVRLVAIGLLPLCLAAGLALRDSGAFDGRTAPWRQAGMTACLGLGSLHHWYVFSQSPSTLHKSVFAAGYLVSIGGCLVLSALELRDLRRRADTIEQGTWTSPPRRSTAS